jgi:hypothetical protein
MIRQYNASPFRYDATGRRVGTVPVGTIAYLQDRLGRSDSPVFRNPWIIVAWLPRECMGKTMAGGHLAIVRSLRDGREQVVADHRIRAALELYDPNNGPAMRSPARPMAKATHGTFPQVAAVA